MMGSEQFDFTEDVERLIEDAQMVAAARTIADRVYDDLDSPEPVLTVTEVGWAQDVLINHCSDPTVKDTCLRALNDWRE